jgi:hypothetical protein
VTAPQAVSEHEFEAAPGLPEPLPEGERILWQGAPDARVLAREALHVRTLSIYFALMLGWRAATVLGDGGGALDAARAVLALLPLAIAAIGLLALIARLMSRTTLYTITDRRVAMRVGVVLTITFNLPYARIESAALRRNADGSGDVSLTLLGGDHIAYAHLWPHARPWHLKRTQPMLRALADAPAVAAILAAALADSAGVARSRVPPAAAAQRPEAVAASAQALTA